GTQPVAQLRSPYWWVVRIPRLEYFRYTRGNGSNQLVGHQCELRHSIRGWPGSVAVEGGSVDLAQSRLELGPYRQGSTPATLSCRAVQQPSVLGLLYL